ncbi:Monoterpene epsilon-lactone hydrolase [Mycobacterium basiliense]|uniref:Monoterpene epsilon-lactone hydrolase n=1 Tax=Mycobacterium basiliense TaxID=2094119 RepID=A0A447GFG3_9MYCO|nr:alpha/beta hydrolase fold domain-containing protein [Mycobacterium basiliense]VDM89198.1 Monoterpene epsilon-lactone hydrolase [Mycobacterium basiliense]
MTSVPSRLLPALLRATGRTRQYASADSAHRHIEERALRPLPYGTPARLRSDLTVAVRRRSGWPLYTVAPQGHVPRRTVVYLHGGAWVNEIAPQHWQLVTQLAAVAQVNVVIPIYPLLPFATAAEVVPAIVELILETLSSEHSVCLAGDSAGGQIALSAAVLLRDNHDVVVPRTTLISPVLEASLSNPLIDVVKETDPWLGREALRVFAERWRAGLPVTDPRVSPLAADLAGLGALTLFSGTRDILNPDARLLAEKAAAAGVDIDYHESPGLLHVYPLTPTPEGRRARAVIVAGLRS